MKGFTEAFRREAEANYHPISVTLIKPAAINTPVTDHARNLMDSKGTCNPPPAYDAHLVARAIMHACTTHVRDLTIGGAGDTSLVLGNRMAQRVMDWVFAKFGHTSMTTELEGDEGQRDNLYEPREDLHDESSLHPMTRKTNLALEAQLNPGVTAAVAGGLSIVALAASVARHGLGKRS